MLRLPAEVSNSSRSISLASKACVNVRMKLLAKGQFFERGYRQCSVMATPFGTRRMF